jgi:hypothetical protein
VAGEHQCGEPFGRLPIQIGAAFDKVANDRNVVHRGDEHERRQVSWPSP